MRFFSHFFAKKEKLKFVLDSDLEVYLKSLGLYTDIQKGHLKCTFCGDRITIVNLSALVPEKKEIKLVCTKYGCVNRVKSNE
jgi:hypothetical protein